MQQTRLTISLAQMDCRRGQPDINEAKAALFVEEAARRGSDLLVLPELWRSGYDLAGGARHAAPLGTGPFQWVAQQARAHGLWIACSLLESEGGSIFNTATLYSPEGELAGAYRKIHLFRLMAEDRYLAAGDSLCVLDLPWGRTALSICYDLRFPEFYRRCCLDGATMVILPAQWPRRRMDAFRVLLRARAAENQCIVLGCNRVGRSDEVRFAGHSAIVDPWGNGVVEAGETELLLTGVVDMGCVSRAREHIPVFADRRPDVYGMEAVS